MCILECFEVSKDIEQKNVIKHEQNVMSPLDCHNICEKNTLCQWFLMNHRNTNMRGCWLLKKDPHFEDSMLKSLVIGPPSCSKYIVCILCI